VHAVLEVLDARKLPQKRWDAYSRPAKGWSEARQKDWQVEMVMLEEVVEEPVSGAVGDAAHVGPCWFWAGGR
jgi:hypothetical protein